MRYLTVGQLAKKLLSSSGGPLPPTRPILSLVRSLKVPLGYGWHEGHEAPGVPWVVTAGMGYSETPGEALFGNTRKLTTVRAREG